MMAQMGFEYGTWGTESDRFTNWATNTAILGGF